MFCQLETFRLSGGAVSASGFERADPPPPENPLLINFGYRCSAAPRIAPDPFAKKSGYNP